MMAAICYSTADITDGRLKVNRKIRHCDRCFLDGRIGIENEAIGIFQGMALCMDCLIRLSEEGIDSEVSEVVNEA